MSLSWHSFDTIENNHLYIKKYIVYMYKNQVARHFDHCNSYPTWRHFFFCFMFRFLTNCNETNFESWFPDWSIRAKFHCHCCWLGLKDGVVSRYWRAAEPDLYDWFWISSFFLFFYLCVLPNWAYKEVVLVLASGAPFNIELVNHHFYYPGGGLNIP